MVHLVAVLFLTPATGALVVQQEYRRLATLQKCSDPVTGISERENFDFKIYPNPSSGLIHIESKKPGAYDIEVINSLGKKIVASRHSGSITIDVQHQPQGIFIIIINRAGQRRDKKSGQIVSLDVSNFIEGRADTYGQ